MLTGSYHGPYIVPENIAFKPDHKDQKMKTLQYSDWAVGNFLKLAKAQSWFEKTLFVITGDHGANYEPIYDADLSYHHVPFIVYAPHILNDSVTNSSLGGQIDIYPTVMGLLGLDYTNNTMGIDLVSETRDYIFFSADDKLGCLSDDYYLIMRNNAEPSLYDYKQGDLTNLIIENRPIADEMESYAHSMLQVAQWMVVNRKME